MITNSSGFAEGSYRHTAYSQEPVTSATPVSAGPVAVFVINRYTVAF